MNTFLTSQTPELQKMKKKIGRQKTIGVNVSCPRIENMM